MCRREAAGMKPLSTRRAYSNRAWRRLLEGCSGLVDKRVEGEERERKSLSKVRVDKGEHPSQPQHKNNSIVLQVTACLLETQAGNNLMLLGGSA